MPALALNQPADPASRMQTRAGVLSRYLHLREICSHHNDNVMKFVSPDALLHSARRLRLAFGKTICTDDDNEMSLAIDLAVHTAPPGRSRAIDRYAAASGFAPDSDEALVLDAMRQAHFSVFVIKRRHEIAGLIVRDVICESEHWLIDIGMEKSAPDDAAFAGRCLFPGAFAMTVGVAVPFDVGLALEALNGMAPLMRKSPGDVVADRRFAEAVYRAALEDGVMDTVVLQPAEVSQQLPSLR